MTQVDGASQEDGRAERRLLAEALQSNRCPICFLLRDDEFQELCRWAGGGLENEEIRRRLDKAGGFCNNHFWLLREIHSPQSGSLVNDYVAAKLLEVLRKPRTDEKRAHAQWLWNAAERCPLCACLRNREARHLRALADWLKAPPSWPEYENSRGLCVPHLVRLQALIDDQTFHEHLARAQAAQVERLQKEMRVFVRQFEAGQRWNISHDEWKAWERVIEKLVGRKGTPYPQ